MLEGRLSWKLLYLRLHCVDHKTDNSGLMWCVETDYLLPMKYWQLTEADWPVEYQGLRLRNYAGRWSRSPVLGMTRSQHSLVEQETLFAAGVAVGSPFYHIQDPWIAVCSFEIDFHGLQLNQDLTHMQGCLEQAHPHTSQQCPCKMMTQCSTVLHSVHAGQLLGLQHLARVQVDLHQNRTCHWNSFGHSRRTQIVAVVVPIQTQTEDSFLVPVGSSSELSLTR